MYVQDYDERFPTMATPAHLQHRVYPYVKNNAIFKCPVTGEDYLGNPALNRVSLGDIGLPANMLMLRDAKPHKSDDGTPVWVAAYVDGHVKLVSKEPVLGKPAPPPSRSSRIKEIRRYLVSLRQSRTQTDKEIRGLEAELRRLTQHK